ncbi:MAG TPA: HAD family phosphatase [Candidatus Limnocylindrales bacterium]|nr:HAD family phosphatase [Candidatus Limnocylindrales bacterium]
MSGFDSILFDFDGVLLDSEPVHCACWAEVLAPLGVTLAWDFYRNNCIGIDDREMLKMMASQSDPPRDWRELWAQYPSKKELFRGRMAKNPPFLSAIGGLLEELSGAYKLAVVSSSACTEIEPLLETAGLRKYFDTVVGGDQVTRHKPDPEPYLLAARRMGVQRPLVVEDSQAGMESARAAGFEVLEIRDPRDVPDFVRARLKTA